MKKILLFVSLIMLTSGLFAQFQIGPTAMLNLQLTGEDVQYIAEEGASVVNELSIDDFTFGVDTRLNLGLLQIGAYGLFSPGYDLSNITDGATIRAFFDAGVTIDLFILRLSAGVGPSMDFLLSENADSTETFDAGFNMKISADVQLGGIAASVVYLTDVKLTVEDISKAFQNINGFVGVSLLFY